MGAHGCVLCKTCLRCTICGGCEHVVDAGWGVPESNSERKAWARLVKAAAGDADHLAGVDGTGTAGQDHWIEVNQGMLARFCGLSRQRTKVTWYLDPPNSPQPGLYVAVDFASSYAKAPQAGEYVVWFRGRDD